MQKIYYAKANFDYQPYLAKLSEISQQKIASYYQADDRLRSFISEWFKYIVITDELKQIFNNAPFTIEEDGYKRPYLNGSFGVTVDFNVSHSGEYVLCGLSTGAKIGIDIEFIDQSINYMGLSSSVFSKQEVKLINSPSDFFNLWAKKESLIKVIGTGFLENIYTETKLDHDPNQIVNYRASDYSFKRIEIDENYYSYCCIENGSYSKLDLIKYDFESLK